MQTKYISSFCGETLVFESKSGKVKGFNDDKVSILKKGLMTMNQWRRTRNQDKTE